MLNHFIFVYLDDVLSFYFFISFFFKKHNLENLENSRLGNVDSFFFSFLDFIIKQGQVKKDYRRSQPVLILACAGLATLECETHRIDKSLMLSHHMNKPKFFVSFILFMSHGQLSLSF